jgi:hypothetical protein
MMNKEVETKKVVFYKVRIKENETTRRYWIFQTAKASVQEIFKHPMFTEIPKEKSPLGEDAVESIELLWEGPGDILDLYSHLLIDIYKVGQTAQMLNSARGTVDSLSQYTMAVELLSDLIKEKTDNLKFLGPCLLETFEPTDNTDNLNKSPILVDDTLLA